MKTKDFILIIILSVIMSSPALFFMHYSMLMHKYVKWERNSIGTEQWIPSSAYCTPKRIFFLENWELPKITKGDD